jgi:hypothetical protein
MKQKKYSMPTTKKITKSGIMEKKGKKNKIPYAQGLFQLNLFCQLSPEVVEGRSHPRQ